MSDLYVIERCRNCPNALIDLDSTESLVKGIFEGANFNSRQKKRLRSDRPMHHQVFRVSISGCPNSCSQPQIKDIGIQGQTVPSVGEGCSLCGECALACPDSSITMGQEVPLIDANKCLNCGVCIKVCPTGAMQGTFTGYRVLAGGKLGRQPRLASLQLKLADQEQLHKCLSDKLELLLTSGKPGERLGQLMERAAFHQQES